MIQDDSTEETRQTILRVAQKLFMENGYRSVSTRQVAQHAAISQPTLYYHFANKQELYVATLLNLLHSMKIELEKITAANNDFETTLTAIALYQLRQTRHNMNLSLVFHDIEAELDQTARNNVGEAFFDSMIMPLLGVLKAGLAQAGHIEPPNGLSLVALAFLFYNMVSSFSEANGEQDKKKFNLNESESDLAVKLVRFYLFGFLANPSV